MKVIVEILRKVFSFYLKDRASAAIMVAAAILPLVIAFGTAFDYNRVLWIKSRFDRASDATTLYMVSKAMSVKSEAELDSRARSFFNAQIAPLVISQKVGVDFVNVSVTTARNGQRKLTVSYKATVSLIFARFFDIKTISISSE